MEKGSIEWYRHMTAAINKELRECQEVIPWHIRKSFTFKIIDKLSSKMVNIQKLYTESILENFKPKYRISATGKVEKI
ncbi:MAG: hypothetical protein H7282_05140 [Cytophagaceae bacterium]|nr:hypothetical protein [Cytophagaceae bacterium]